jgi:hypothetical protein
MKLEKQKVSVMQHFFNLFRRYKVVADVPEWVKKQFKKDYKKRKKEKYRYKGKNYRYKIILGKDKVTFKKRERVWITPEWEKVSRKKVPKKIRGRVGHVNHHGVGEVYTWRFKGKKYKYKFILSHHANVGFNDGWWRKRKRKYKD